MRVLAWVSEGSLSGKDFLYPSRVKGAGEFSRASFIPWTLAGSTKYQMCQKSGRPGEWRIGVYFHGKLVVYLGC